MWSSEKMDMHSHAERDLQGHALTCRMTRTTRLSGELLGRGSSTLWERMGSINCRSTTFPAPTVEGPPTNSCNRAAQEFWGKQAAIKPAATCSSRPHASHCVSG